MGKVSRGTGSVPVVHVPVESAAEAEALAQEALRFIARLARRADLELMIEIGDYVVEKFFAGQLDLARSSSPTKPVALKRLEQLAGLEEIPVSRLRVAISMSVQYRSLPVAVRDRLSVRQHRALLPVKDPQAKSKLAKQALSGKLSGDDLAKLVRSQHGPAQTGRKPMGELERSLSAARRALVSSLVENALEPAKVRALEPSLRARLARDARTLRERLERIADALGGLR